MSANHVFLQFCKGSYFFKEKQMIGRFIDGIGEGLKVHCDQTYRNE